MADTPESDTGSGVGRRNFLKAAGAGGAGVALAGCRTRGTTDGDDGGGGGGVGGEGPLSGQTIRIGSLAPDPENFPIGMSMWNSMQMAVQTLNKKGGIAGAKVKAFSGNTEASPGTGSEEFLRLAQKERCDAMFGTFLTQVTLQCFAPMSQTQTPLICTAAAGPKPARVVNQQYDKYKYFFRVGPLNSFDLAKAELEFLEIYAKKLGWDRVAVLTENIGPFDPFSELLDGNIRDIVDVPIFKRTSSGTTNWTPVWDEVESADIDLALIAQALTGTASVKQWFNEKRQFEMGGIHVPDQVYEFWGEVGGACEHTFTMNAVTPQTTNTPQTQPYMKRYNKQFNTYPVYSGPLTYDGVFVYAKAVEDCVKGEGLDEVPDVETLIPYLENVRYTNGTIIPEFQFTPKDAKFAHDPQWNSMKESGVPVWQQWQRDPEIRKDYGVMHSVAPEQNKSADYTYPDWINYPSNHPANN